MQCVYCCEEKPREDFRKREHVMPKSFGTFTDNFVLHEVVCDECNQYFGNALELALGRDTIEGSYRFEYGVRDPSEFRSLGADSRVSVRLGEGPLQGACAFRHYSPEKGNIVVDLLPQVGFLERGSSEYRFFLLQDIPEKSVLELQGYDLDHPKGMFILGCAEEEASRALAERGITFEYGGEVTGSCPPDYQALCEIEATVDTTIRRAFAKVAFNYLTYWEKADFVHDPAFTPIRRYIRFGERPSLEPVRDTWKAILADEPADGLRRLGHIVALDWSPDGQRIVAQVSLFNWMVY